MRKTGAGVSWGSLEEGNKKNRHAHSDVEENVRRNDTDGDREKKKRERGVLPALAPAIQKPFSESRINPDLRSQWQGSLVQDFT